MNRLECENLCFWVAKKFCYSNWNNPGNSLSKIRNMVYSSNELSFFLKQWKHRQRKKYREIIICTNLHNFYKLASSSILFSWITVSEQIKRLATWFKLGGYGLRRFPIWFQKILHIFIIIIEISKKWSTEFVGYT